MNSYELNVMKTLAIENERLEVEKLGKIIEVSVETALANVINQISSSMNKNQ